MLVRFCPSCGHAYSKQEGFIRSCTSCDQTFFINSKPTASTLIVDGKKILLGKRAREPSKGRWNVIGGFLEYGEDPKAGAKREAKEETGYDVELTDFLGVFMDEYGVDKEATLNLCYVAVIVGGCALAQDDIGELRWFDISKIPEDIAFECNRQMIKAWKKKVGVQNVEGNDVK